MIRRACRFAISLPRHLFKLALFAAALAGGGFLALAAFHESVQGSGVPFTEDRYVDAVTEVSLTGIGDLTIVQGDVPSLSVTADDNILPLLETESSGNKLTIGTKFNYSINRKTRISYTLTVPQLRQISVSGAGTAKVERMATDNLTVKVSGAGNAKLGEVTCSVVTLNLSGAGHATLGGTADKLTVRLSGAGEVDAAALQAKTADVQVSGAGTAKVWATDELKARVSGAGGVKYKGAAKLDRRVSGAGSVTPLK